ncbi:MAG: tRNA 2-thiouridine(34) synthase MnmA [Erysipelotrichaceae bacterium]|nr:tRNA 2-thiouridine(34) synthase MnmA [Erysipelotrichaceae bacterium]
MKILLGLSGGVDSAVAAYLLKAQGHDVECAFMRNWDSLTNNDILGNPTLDAAICTQEEDYNDALNVANSLGLILHRVDFIKEYWDEVFTIFLDEYKKGRTPNPDILCNKHIKFDHFFDYAMTHGFDFVATGHYARVVHKADHSLMLKGLDLNKDQSYFLAQISQKALSKTLFPLGDLDKPEVRRIANELKLSVAKKKDSTGICFIGERDFKAFLANYLPAKNGPIIELETKKILGEHLGVLYYTLGQRKGLDISAHEGPWFVAGKDIQSNELYVVKGEDNPWLTSDSAIVKDLNWFNPIDLSDGLECSAKFRYRQKDQKVRIKSMGKDTLLVEYKHPISSVTPGQEAVFYLGDECLGGGVIDDVFVDQLGLQERLKAKR